MSNAPAAQQGAAADVAQRVPLDLGSLLALDLGASATVGGLCHAAERPVRWAAGSISVAYDEQLAARIRCAVKRRRGISEKKMFGGLAFLLRGNMFCGVVGHDLMVRVGPAGYEAALQRAHVHEMDFTGRPLRGMVYVRPPGVRSAQRLESWIDDGLDFARSLPAK